MHLIVSEFCYPNVVFFFLIFHDITIKSAFLFDNDVISIDICPNRILDLRRFVIQTDAWRKLNQLFTKPDTLL